MSARGKSCCGESCCGESWLEVAPKDFLRKTVAQTTAAQRQLLDRRIGQDLLLRVVLREASDLKSGINRGRDPLFVHDYRFGHAMILRQADEVVIERSNGLRYRVDRARSPWTATPVTLHATAAKRPRP